MSFADTPYVGPQRFLPGQHVLLKLLIRNATRGPGAPRQQDAPPLDPPPFDPNLGVIFNIYRGQARILVLAALDGIRVQPGVYQATYEGSVSDPPGQYLVEAVATHGPSVQRTWYRGGFVIVED